MRKIATILFLFIVLFQKECFAQFYKQLDTLCIMCNRSTSDSQKVSSLGKLADFYYIFKLNSKGDSVLHQQLLVAELSNDSNLILQALFGDAILNIGSSATTESFNKTIEFVQKGIDYAKANNKYDYHALGYIRMSEIFRKRGEYEKAFTNSILALSLLQNVTSDSVKSITYIELGDTYLDRGESVSACSNYNNAFDIAVKIKSIVLQSKIHHRISEMYKKLDDRDHAKEELNQSMLLNKKMGNQEGLMMDYFDLARLNDEKFFIQRSIELADSLHDYKNLLNAKRLMLVYHYVIEKNEQEALRYLENEPDLKQSYLNDGLENYFITLGNIFFYTGHIDSALDYYKIAGPELDKKFDHNLSRINLEQIAESYSLKSNFPEAISYYLKALQISLQMKDFNTIALYSGKLSGLYEKQNDYKNAFVYSKQFVIYKDSVRELSKENDIALLGIERENKKHENELFQEKQRDYNSRNIQYMGITISIIIIFFIMLVVGSFPVSRRTVKLMGYFFFISLFEFIVLLIDNLVLSHSVHNQPLKLWIIKIVVIAVLVPFQHFLEHHVIGLLASKKLIEARTKFSVKKWWAGITKPVSSADESLEEDTAVL
jgi:tetratricopeptide (TPR) repeat protein